MKSYKSLYLVFVATIIVSCNNEGRVYSLFYDLPDENWNWDNPLFFEYEIVDTSVTYNHIIQFRLTDNYSKSNIYIIKKVILPNGDTLPEMLINCPLFNEEGQVFGYKSGIFYHAEAVISKNKAAKQIGKHKVILVQHTREFILPGVNSVGYLVNKGEPVF